MKKHLLKLVLALLGGFAIQTASHAQGVPQITPSLRKMLGALPISGMQADVKAMVGALKKTSCGGGLSGCYMTKSGATQLYFFTSGTAQQSLLLVIDESMSLPKLLKDNVQKVLGGTQLQSPIISLSTTDYVLDIGKMPPDLQRVVHDHYFNVASLEFAEGVQLAARANLGGAMKLTMEAMGVKGDQLTLRAAVVMPIPTDLAGGAGAGAGLADALHHGDTMAKAGAKAAMPEAFIEFQLAPNALVPLALPRMDLTDATFFINNVLTFGYKGNAAYKGVPGKKFVVQFQTPLDPAGALDLLDFSFRIATPPSFTLADEVQALASLASADARLVKYGGGFVRNIGAYKSALLMATKPLSVFQLNNPHPVEYRFGDSTRPFPSDPKVFNELVFGPLAQGGPLLELDGDVTILGQKMGSLFASAGTSGLHASATSDLVLKLGPLGKVKVEKVAAHADIDQNKQAVSLKGNFGGQAIDVELAGSTLTVSMSASCVNPFEIKASVAIQDSTDIADVFAGQGGANVDPNSITGCVGAQLQAALGKIAGEYRNLDGYTAAAANAQLKQISDAAAAAAAAAAAKAQRDYNAAKDKARDAANHTSNSAMTAFNDAGNAFKKLGGSKKKHHKGPDPKFAESVFDWDYYYDNAPDVVRAGVDLASHWRDNGFNEGRQGSTTFSAAFYLQHYPDLMSYCGAGNYACAVQHWLDHGIDEGRQGSADFSTKSYLNRYPDLVNAFGKTNYPDALHHWITNGQDEGRDGAP